MYPIPEDDDKLLLECDVETFRSGGKGGQNVNKVSSAVRLTHRPSGIVVTSQRERSQYQNKNNCLRVLRERLEVLNRPEVPRIPTREPRSVRRKVRISKERRSLLKSHRARPRLDD